MSSRSCSSRVARLQGGGEVGAGDREADADVTAVVVPEAGVDADVDRLARVGERPDPAADVDLLVAVEVDRVDRAHHPALRFLDVRRDRGLAERLGDQSLEDLVSRFHPLPPLRDDRELEAAGVLVELANQRVHAGRVEGRTVEAVERGEDADVGRVAAERSAADLGELLDVVGADVPRAGLERHDVAQLGRRHLLGHHAHQRPVAVRDRRDRRDTRPPPPRRPAPAPRRRRAPEAARPRRRPPPVRAQPSAGAARVVRAAHR